MEQSRERSSALPYIMEVVAIEREPSGHLRLRSPTLLLLYQVFDFILIRLYNISPNSLCVGNWPPYHNTKVATKIRIYDEV